MFGKFEEALVARDELGLTEAKLRELRAPSDYAWVIANNEYTKSALELASSTKTLLWNGRKLKEMAIFADY